MKLCHAGALKPDNISMAVTAGIALAVFLLLVSGPGRSEPTDRVDQTIQYLISYVSGSDLNGTKLSLKLFRMSIFFHSFPC